MLVLTRKLGEGIWFDLSALPPGSKGWLVVTKLQGDRVGIGLQFPDEAKIFRHELVSDEVLATAPETLKAD